MLKWLFTLLLFVLVIGVVQPGLARWLQLGRLPGDLAFTLRGRTFRFPFTSTLLICGLAWVLMRLL
ncbi:MAG: DUF2905 domain-containing protein [Zoogloea sp.]|nr:DUF2905 domain-containing protein [Zoogloea sp.]